jgi:hypothetical protein
VDPEHDRFQVLLGDIVPLDRKERTPNIEEQAILGADFSGLNALRAVFERGYVTRRVRDFGTGPSLERLRISDSSEDEVSPVTVSVGQRQSASVNAMPTL